MHSHRATTDDLGPTDIIASPGGRQPAAPADEAGAHYLNEIRGFPMLEPEQEFRLAKRWREHGDRAAADQLVTSHLRLAAKLAMRYRGYGLPVCDIIAEGNVGLVQAVDRFEPEKGFRFATYAMWWIRAAIQAYVLRSWSLVKIGPNASQKKLFFKLRSAKTRIAALETGDMRPDQVRLIATSLGVREREVVDMNRRLGRDASLNTLIPGDDQAGQWQDYLVDESPTPDVILAEHEETEFQREALAAAIGSLNERERRIFLARHLVDKPLKLGELAIEFGLSRERVRQIETRAFEKVRGAANRQVADTRTPAALDA